MSGPAQEIINKEKATSWMEAKTALIKEFNDHRPYDNLISDLYRTPYQGSISKFAKELKLRATIVINK